MPREEPTGTTIWKFPIEIKKRQTITMPAGAQILSAQMQGQMLCLWALVNPAAPGKDREIEVLGTGNLLSDENRRYISTAQMDGGAMMWHVFEIKADNG